MKSCPKCNRTYADSLSFCVEDGATLSAPFDLNPTLVIPSTESAASTTKNETKEKAFEPSVASQPRNSHSLYVIILFLAVIATAIGVILFYELSKGDIASDGTKTKESSATSTTTQNLNGEWEIIDTVETSSNPEYINVKVSFRLFIKQVGQEITGEGERAWISTRTLQPQEHTPIHITGLIKDDIVEATFVEEGSSRKTSGRFVWRIEGGNRMVGTFVSTAANTSGKSVVTKR